MFTALLARRRRLSISVAMAASLCRNGADAVQPGNAKRSDVKKILNAAALHFEELAALWEEMHGET
jgi:hypothetical protein